jgi:ubiquinone/menaquinone biosynthesis C-methylase UbiE
MSFLFRIRDWLRPRREILDEVGIRPGFRVLDYGCGPGGYIPVAAEMVGESGRVYALDIHPLAVRRVDEMARKRGLTNVETIQSDCRTGLPAGSIDMVLLYDVLHGLGEPKAVLTELHRVLKDDGQLSFNDHHLPEYDILARVTSGGLFELVDQGVHTYTFSKRPVVA